MPEKIEFDTFIQSYVASAGRGYFIRIPREEEEKVMWCHQGTGVTVTIKPIGETKDAPSV